MDDNDHIGTTLDGRYKIERLLGRGGMGRVYQATHLGLDRSVAIKMLDPRLVSDDEARRRFEREATSTGKLRHPNCVGVTDSGATPDGGRYLVMELVEGKSLDDVLFESPRLSVARAVHIMRHVLRGLAHAHAQGLVHRDLKPANIMIAREGDDADFARILDFGLARAIGGGGDRITRTGIVCGTPSYMSPEQVLDRGLDARVDLYAASVILFEMLAGHTPYQAEESTAILQMHLRGEVPALDVPVPPALEALVRRGLAKRAEDRPASAAAYLAELERACPPESDTIALTGSLSSVIVPSPRRRWGAIGAAGIGVLLVGIVAAVASSGSSSSAAAAPAIAAAPAVASDDPAIEIDPAPTATDPAIQSALALGGEAAVAKLRDLARRHPDDAQIPRALGHVYARLGWPRPEVDAYRDALQLDPTLRADDTMIRDLVDQLASKSTWQLAASALEHDIGTPADAALAACAAHDHDATVRERCASVRARL